MAQVNVTKAPIRARAELSMLHDLLELPVEDALGEPHIWPLTLLQEWQACIIDSYMRSNRRARALECLQFFTNCSQRHAELLMDELVKIMDEYPDVVRLDEPALDQFYQVITLYKKFGNVVAGEYELARQRFIDNDL